MLGRCFTVFNAPGQVLFRSIPAPKRIFHTIEPRDAYSFNLYCPTLQNRPRGDQQICWSALRGTRSNPCRNRHRFALFDVAQDRNSSLRSAGKRGFAYSCSAPAVLVLEPRVSSSLLGKGGTTDFQVRPLGIRRTSKSVVPLNQQPGKRGTCGIPPGPRADGGLDCVSIFLGLLGTVDGLQLRCCGCSRWVRIAYN